MKNRLMIEAIQIKEANLSWCNNKTLLLPFVALVMLATGCATIPPTNVDNACAMLKEKDRWYPQAKKAQDKWGVSVPIILATMHQESRFVHNARPPRKKVFGFIPGSRPSDSYGYSQALKSTWREYQRSTGDYGANRGDFGDAANFIGWYHNNSFKRSGISKSDPYHLYLAYHEGHGGFNRRSFKNKAWLKKVATKVTKRSRQYATQLQRCESELKPRTRWFFGLF